MVITLTLDDHLATQLQARATAQRLSVEAMTLQLLAEAIAHGDTTPWETLHQRRIALLQQQYTPGLTPAEANELAQLQEQADQQLAPLDQRLLEHVTALHQQAQRLVEPSQP
ncbi:MAG: hypothetical protein FJZ47_22180 [Candidatus Tectomicrobia bacterium]|uniref:Uncharacterized protein n=1 Tax=Tectimicrobiota bacterium TaxID=2528274 RepID=A0A938B2T2_UNCTE|nr:hypothetical protein [Candidatus Tectomicrobia bacterium]